MIRTVEPEILDTLAEDDPDALHNRRDITKFNTLMGNFRWFRQKLNSRISSGDHILEIGAGGGELGSFLDKNLHQSFPLNIDGLDLWTRPVDWPHDWGWTQADLTTYDNYSPYSIVMANMILHQFKESDLKCLGQKISHNARLILASEPARSAAGIFLFRACSPFLGINWVTKNDALLSIKAGFKGQELPQLLGLKQDEWKWTCRTGLLGQYRMVAARRD